MPSGLPQYHASFIFDHVFNLTVGFTLRKMKAQLKKKMIKSGFVCFLTSLFFLLKALLCCNKAVLYQMAINVYHIIGTISG